MFIITGTFLSPLSCEHSFCIYVQLNSRWSTEWHVSCWELLPNWPLMPLHDFMYFKRCIRQLNVLWVVEFHGIGSYNTTECGNKKHVKRSAELYSNMEYKLCTPFNFASYVHTYYWHVCFSQKQSTAQIFRIYI